MKVISQLVPLLAAVLYVSAHGVITDVSGANGVTAAGFGVIATTPRDGSTRVPFQQDSSIIRDREISLGTADICGRTLGGGINDVQTMLADASTAGLPTAFSDGSVEMTLHQVNGDGAGPYTCVVSADATGQDFVSMTVTTQVPGQNSASNVKATPFPLVAQMPVGLTCTGGPNGDACLVRCRNAAIAGPFGGCVAVTTANSGRATNAVGTPGGVAIGSDGTDVAATVVPAFEGPVAARPPASAGPARRPTQVGLAPGGRTGQVGFGRAIQKQKITGVEVASIPDVSLEEANAALAKDLDRRERVGRSRIVGRLLEIL